MVVAVHYTMTSTVLINIITSSHPPPLGGVVVCDRDIITIFRPLFLLAFEPRRASSLRQYSPSIPFEQLKLSRAKAPTTVPRALVLFFVLYLPLPLFFRVPVRTPRAQCYFPFPGCVSHYYDSGSSFFFFSDVFAPSIHLPLPLAVVTSDAG